MIDKKNLSENTLPHVAIVTSGYLPVPNVLGGAVEALDMMLVQENEHNPCFNFTVFSSWTSKAQQVACKRQFSHTKFVFIKIPWLVSALDRCIYVLAKYVFRKKKLMSYRYIMQRLWYICKVSAALARDDMNGEAVYDKVMIENHATLFIIMKLFGNANRYRGRVYYHLHNEVLNDFGCKQEIAHVGKVLGVSNYIVNTLDRFLHEHGEAGLTSAQRAVWHNCVDVTHFGSIEACARRSEWRVRYGITENEIVFLFSGRLTPEKGAVQLLEAFRQVINIVPNAHLVIAGAYFFNSNITSPFERRLQEIAEDATIKDSITFTGFVDYSDMPAVYAMADVCVLSSVLDDPAPLAVIESLVSGKPLITTRSGGIPEYADKQTAIFIERDDQLVDHLAQAMIELACSPQRRMEMGMHGTSLRSCFSQQSYLAQLVELMR